MYQLTCMAKWINISSLAAKAKKKIPVFRVTQPYLNLLVKPRFLFLGFLKKKLHFERHFICLDALLRLRLSNL